MTQINVEVKKTTYRIVLRVGDEVSNTAKVVFVNDTLLDVTDTSDSVCRHFDDWNSLLIDLYDKAYDYADASPKTLLNIWRAEANLPITDYCHIYIDKEKEL